MPNKIDSLASTPPIEQSRKAGDIEPFPSGRITYLAPLPLPTPMPPHGPHIGELNDVFMDFGLGWPQVFSWQVILGGPLSGTFMVLFLFPLFTGFLGVVFGYGREDIWESITGVFDEGYGYGLVTGVCSLLIGLFTWHHNHKKGDARMVRAVAEGAMGQAQ